jgi:hypothetical protein
LSALKALSAMHSLGKRISSVQLRVGAPPPQSNQRSGGFHKPAASGAAPETATILRSSRSAEPRMAGHFRLLAAACRGSLYEPRAGATPAGGPISPLA